MLGLMVSSIAQFAGEIGSENIIRKHVETSRARTVGRTVDRFPGDGKARDTCGRTKTNDIRPDQPGGPFDY